MKLNFKNLKIKIKIICYIAFQIENIAYTHTHTIKCTLKNVSPSLRTRILQASSKLSMCSSMIPCAYYRIK